MFSSHIVLRALLGAAAMLAMFTPATMQAETDTRCYEMRVYQVAPGKAQDLHARFRNHTLRLFQKHGIESIGYWTPLENPDSKVVFVIAYPSREEREVRWNAFINDPEWVAAKAESERNGPLVTKPDNFFLQATDFSPAVKPSVGSAPRVFELRTYTTTPGNQERLLKRFREHTTMLFARHGMTNLFYWTMLPGQPDAERKLIYMLAHASKDAGAESFKAFRADPEWIAAKSASEQEGGGSLTVAENGVVSEFLQATDYSPTK